MSLYFSCLDINQPLRAITDKVQIGPREEHALGLLYGNTKPPSPQATSFGGKKLLSRENFGFVVWLVFVSEWAVLNVKNIKATYKGVSIF